MYQNIPLYVFTVLFIHSSVDGYLACFYLLAVMNNASMNMGVQISLQDLLSIIWGICPKAELLNHMVILF